MVKKSTPKLSSKETKSTGEDTTPNCVLIFFNKTFFPHTKGHEYQMDLPETTSGELQCRNTCRIINWLLCENASICLSEENFGCLSVTGSNTNAKLNATWNHEAHIKYRLSDKDFVTRGWTKLPQEVVIQKITTYKTFSAKPHMLLFKKRHQTEYRYYPDGTRAAVFKPDGSGTIYYPSGRVAVHCQDKIYIILSPGGKDPLTGYLRAQVITALFDMLGNGIVYDNEGHVVLNFTQRLGVFEGTQNGLPIKWSWPVRIKEDESVTVPECQKCFYLDEDTKRNSEANSSITDKQNQNDNSGGQFGPERRQSVRDGLHTTTSEEAKKGRKKGRAPKTGPHSMPSLHESRAPTQGSNRKIGLEESNEVHSRNSLVASSQPLLPIKEEKESAQSLEINYVQHMKSLKTIMKKHCRSKCTPIKPILRRLNQYMSLRILDQANVSVTFYACGQIFRLELGVVIDPSEIVQINKVVMKETKSVGGVVNYFEQFPNQSLESALNRLTRQRDWSSERMRERLRVAKRCGGFV